MKKKETKSDFPEPLSRERILDQALEIADAYGLDALSMRNLAASLGVQAMSLYNHIQNKDELIDGISDLVIQEFAVPKAGGDWKEEMRKRAQSMRAVLLTHRWAAQTIMQRINSGYGMIRFFDGTIGCLVHAGFDYPKADHITNAMDSFIYGYVLQELNFPIHVDDYTAMASAYLPTIPKDQFPHIHELTNYIIDGRHSGIHDLMFGFNQLLEAFESQLTRRNT